MKQSFKYSLKVWISSALAAPLVLVLVKMLAHDKNGVATLSDIVSPYYLMGAFIYLLVTALPWVAMFFIMSWLPSFGWPGWVNQLAAVVVIEILLGLIPLIGTWSSPADGHSNFLSWLSFAIPTALFVCIYRITPAETAPAQANGADVSE